MNHQQFSASVKAVQQQHVDNISAWLMTLGKDPTPELRRQMREETGKVFVRGYTVPDFARRAPKARRKAKPVTKKRISTAPQKQTVKVNGRPAGVMH